MRFRPLFLSLAFAAVLGAGSVAVFMPRSADVSSSTAPSISIKGTPVYQSPVLLEKAWALSVARLYRHSVEYQRNPSVCGPASVANVLHSLDLAGNQEFVLEGSGIRSYFGYLPKGVTLDQLADITGRQTVRKVSVLRDLDVAAFRDHLRRSNDATRRYIVNFNRAPLFGTGSGHHSPVAGYLVDEDLVLILDVNEAYGPWLVPSQRLYDAMNTTDTESSRKRGLLLIE